MGRGTAGVVEGGEEGGVVGGLLCVGGGEGEVGFDEFADGGGEVREV